MIIKRGYLLYSVVGAVLLAGAAHAAESKNDKVALIRARITESRPPYWVRDFKKSDDFKSRSLEMTKLIPKYVDDPRTPFCIAHFLNSKGTRFGRVSCARTVSENGYDKTCEGYTVELATGNYVTKQEINFKACDEESVYRFMRLSGDFLEADTAYGIDGDIGVMLFKDQYGLHP